MQAPVDKGTKEKDRVTVHEERGNESGPLRFKRVDIKYSDGDLFYSGWIQDFGDVRTGPTFFEQNYKNFNLERERVFKREKYWLPFTGDPADIALREAREEDLDDIIDLTFQNYFDGGHNKISAYQGLMHRLDRDHVTIGATVNNSVFGYLYIDLTSASRGEAYFDSLYCVPGLRGRGGGNRLISAGLDRVKATGLKKVSGTIIGDLDHCERMARMLGNHGFRVVEATENTPDWCEVYLMKTV